jgi:catalase (peroxidase I)
VNGYNVTQFESVNGNWFLTPSDLNLAWDSSFLAIAQDFSANQQLFLDEFIGAWTKLASLDRF